MNVFLAVLLAAGALAHDQWSEPFEGVRYLHRTTANPKLAIHAAVVDLTDPGVRVVATGPGDKRTTVSEFAGRRRAQLAVNGDFFNLNTRIPICYAMGAGEHWLGTGDDGGCGQLAAGPHRVELIPPPEEFRHQEWMTDVVSGHPMILKNGETVHADDGLLRVRHPRTAVGLDRDNRRLFLLVVDGRQSHSIGTTGAEMAAVMRELGAWNALNLDGGGSSAMYLQGKGVVNKPSDGREREDANHLGVLARPRGGGGGATTGGTSGGGSGGSGGGTGGGSGGGTGGGSTGGTGGSSTGGSGGGSSGSSGSSGGSTGGGTTGSEPVSGNDPRLLPGFGPALLKGKGGKALTEHEERVLRRALKVGEADVEKLMAAALARDVGEPPASLRLKRGPVTPVDGELLREFGPSSYPLYPPRPADGRMHAHFHSGLDLGAREGAPVRAFDAGKVLFVGASAGPGIQVVLAHPGKLATAYWHLAGESSVTPRLRVGDWVGAGDVIGLLGDTGVALRPHLHFMASRGWLIDPKKLLLPIPPPGQREAAYRDLPSSRLVVAATLELADGSERRPEPGLDLSRVPAGARVRLLPTVDERGNRYLAAFTSWERLAGWKADATGVAMPAKTALAEVERGGFAGVLLDADTPYAMAVPADKAKELAR